MSFSHGHPFYSYDYQKWLIPHLWAHGTPGLLGAVGLILLTLLKLFCQHLRICFSCVQSFLCQTNISFISVTAVLSCLLPVAVLNNQASTFDLNSPCFWKMFSLEMILSTLSLPQRVLSHICFSSGEKFPVFHGMWISLLLFQRILGLQLGLHWQISVTICLVQSRAGGTFIAICHGMRLLLPWKGDILMSLSFFPNTSLVVGKSLFVEHWASFPSLAWGQQKGNPRKSTSGAVLAQVMVLNPGALFQLGPEIVQWLFCLEVSCFLLPCSLQSNLPRVELSCGRFIASLQLCLPAGANLTTLGSLPLHSSFLRFKSEIERRNNVIPPVVLFFCALLMNLVGEPGSPSSFYAVNLLHCFLLYFPGFCSHKDTQLPVHRAGPPRLGMNRDSPFLATSITFLVF